MTDETVTPLAAWTHTPESIPQGGLKTNREATAAERDAIAAALDLVSVQMVAFDYAIKNKGGGAYRMTGRLKADIVQSCVVTLDPVPSQIEEDLQVEFRPEARALRPAKGKDADEEADTLDVDFESDVDIEPITDGHMEIGRIVFETLASAIDPYPRKPGAAFDWKGSEDAKSDRPNPFAALEKLKNKT